MNLDRRSFVVCLLDAIRRALVSCRGPSCRDALTFPAFGSWLMRSLFGLDTEGRF